ncbi:MAG: GAF domain-containing protein [Candidatus Pseudobacter hemicellulosilyticus]|uniref:GAF domain-containing protein n=1 Tax=Candidatus Pseudobacter hemicellulosilyticus TaxID=3121375 RepID=A0AAJ6BDV4_9BACT|nr:MAG: GAF domain-containing protein [Pseudobacter sp.]
MSQFSKYDSEFCGNIPIHIINAIQEYGVLLVLDKQELLIRQLSENAGDFFSSGFRDLPGRPVSELIADGDYAELQELVAKGEPVRLARVWNFSGRYHQLVLHIQEQLVLLEIETAPNPESPESFTELYQIIRTSINRIEAAGTEVEVCRVAADEIKRISGFDKVMIYAFDKDWNGNVMAEAMEPDMESYIGFTFPASDIPKPARDLYLRNPYRFIPDKDFKPVKLYPVINPVSGSFLDMSDCNLRAVAAVHVEYLKNMRVQASMSVRLIRDEALWGLIACHHKTARRIDGQLCTILELLSTIISSRLNLLYHQHLRNLSTRLNSSYTELIEDIYQRDDLIQGLLEKQGGILELLDSQGVVITWRNRTWKEGDTPDAGDLEDLLLWLNLKQLRKVYYTDHLAGEYEMPAALQEKISGILVIPINVAQDEYIFLFRRELIKTTNWGGNPAERIFFEADSQIYHPRHSFKLWQEIIKGYSKPWQAEEIMTAENLRSFIFEFLTPQAQS